ncbi:MAG: DUF4349 domain-containing protein [Chthoniobacterales bacterium]
MPTIHEDIEQWLAASVHDQLSPNERTQLHEHLATCAACRALHDQEIAMNRLIESTLEATKPDLAFEQRVVSGFRKTAPRRSGLTQLLANLLRFRATQIAAVAALLLALAQTGRVLTNERSAFGGNGIAPVLATAPLEQQRDERSDRPAMKAFPSGPAAMAPHSAPADALKDTVQVEPLTPASRSMPIQSAAGGAIRARASQTEAARVQEPEEPSGQPVPASPVDTNRKLVRNAQVELEVIKFEDAVAKITAFAADARGYVATSSSEKQANGKLRGQVVVKVLPDMLDAFLGQLRGLGEVKNQTLGTEDVTKQYFDTDSRLKSARVMEQRLIDILKTKSNKVADLLEVEKELGRVRAQIEQMQGELKYMDAQVAFATVTLTLAEKDMDVPAAFLLQRRAQLALFSTDVEKTFAEMKSVIDGAKAQISSSNLDRDSAGEATARLVLLIAPEDADALIARIKGMGRVQNYNEQTDRIAQGGNGMAENAKVKRDKVQLSIVISRNEQEPALQTTSLSILTSSVAEKAALLKANAAKAGAEIRNSSFSRQPNGQEFANLTLRVPMKNYPALMSSFEQLGKVKDVSVQRDDRRGTINEATAPTDINIRIYSQADIVADESGLFATIRRTLGQGAAALTWSLRMIGVALAFFAPWVLSIAVVIWIVRRIARARKARRDNSG